MRDGLAIALAVIGLFFSLTAAVGLLRMPDLYTRIQCSSKSATMGILPLLLAIAVAKGFITPYGGRALFVAVLVLVFNPAAAHAMARAAYKVGVPMWRGAVVDEAAERADAMQDGED